MDGVEFRVTSWMTPTSEYYARATHRNFRFHAQTGCFILISIYESWFPKRTGRLSTIAKKIYYVRSCFYGVDFLFVHACLISDLLFHTVRLPWNFLCPFHRPAATSFSPAYLPRSSMHAGRLAWSSSLQWWMPAEQRPYPYRSSFHTTRT